MSFYRRNRVPGGTYFFTVNLADRNSSLLTTRIDLLRDAARCMRQRSPTHIDARVILPGHMHCIRTLPPGDDDYSSRWRGDAITHRQRLNSVLSATGVVEREGDPPYEGGRGRPDP